MGFSATRYMVADARPPAMTRQCLRATGEPKRIYPDRHRAKRTIRILARWSLEPYVCEQGHHHIGHKQGSR